MNDWEPPEIVIPRPKPWGRIVAILLALAVAGGGFWFYRDHMPSAAGAPLTGLADHVRTDVTGAGASIDLVVSWKFSDLGHAGLPDSVRVEVGVEGTDPRVDLLPGRSRADTLRLVAPAVGTTAMGHSCVSGVHGSRLSRETCTPWQFVRPAAETGTVPKGEKPDSVSKKPKRAAVAASTPRVLRIVIRPSGRQVDPDLGGKCSEWQQGNPDRPVWIVVNETAVADCMGPNGKPTIAQFCAFAVLEDGARVKTENSTNNPYCEGLFEAWVRERIS